jgi:Tfp pilus assembly protein PilF
MYYTELLEKGYACLRRGDPQSALIRFQNAIESEPERPQGYFAQAQAYLEQGLRDETRHTLETALRIDPTYVPARAYLAIELLKNYDLDGAQKELDQALLDEPANLLAHLKYAEYYYRLGFYPRSVELLEQGLKGPHGANEHVVAMARQFLTQAREKSKNLILREPPDPRLLRKLLSRLRPQKRQITSQNTRPS